MELFSHIMLTYIARSLWLNVWDSCLLDTNQCNCVTVHLLYVATLCEAVFLPLGIGPRRWSAYLTMSVASLSDGSCSAYPSINALAVAYVVACLFWASLVCTVVFVPLGIGQRGWSAYRAIRTLSSWSCFGLQRNQ